MVVEEIGVVVSDCGRTRRRRSPSLYCLSVHAVTSHASRVTPRPSWTSFPLPSLPRSSAPWWPCATAAGARRRRAFRPRLDESSCPIGRSRRVGSVGANASLRHAPKRRRRRGICRRPAAGVSLSSAGRVPPPLSLTGGPVLAGLNPRARGSAASLGRPAVDLAAVSLDLARVFPCPFLFILFSIQQKQA